MLTMQKEQQSALITGIRGQDAAFLAHLLLREGYLVYGLDRRSGESSFWRLRELGIEQDVAIVHADLTEYHAVKKAISGIRPSLIFNLAAQSFVKASFDNPFTTIDVNTIGLLNILESVRELGMVDTRIYQASTSELFGIPLEVPQRETTPFYPRSPYGVSKLAAHWLAVNYRESYGMFCCCGILFNHESELRGEEFVTRKIAKGVAEIALGKRKNPIVLGNLDAMRDWGYAGDFVKAMYKILTADKPADYVVATGKTISVREFVEIAFNTVGKHIVWDKTKDGYDIGLCDGSIVVETSAEFYRPAEVSLLRGDYSKIKEELSWSPECDVVELAQRMVQADIERLQSGTCNMRRLVNNYV